MINVISISLCVTTKNRPEYINELLFSVPIKTLLEIEVVIVDSSNCNKTKRVVDNHPLINTHSVIYKKQECNISEGYSIAAEIATGEFLWFFSDDDVLCSNSINYIGNFLEKKDKISLLLINSLSYDGTLRNCLSLSRFGAFDSFLFNHELRSWIEYFETYAGHFGLISSVFVSRDHWHLANKVNSSFKCDYFNHIAVIFSTIPSGRWGVIGRPLFAVREGPKSWDQKYIEVWSNNFKKVIFSIEFFKEKSHKIAYSNTINSEFAFILKSIFLLRGSVEKRAINRVLKMKLGYIERLIIKTSLLIPVNIRLVMMLIVSSLITKNNIVSKEIVDKLKSSKNVK